MNYTLRFERITSSQELVLIFFYQDNCKDCETMQIMLKIVQQRLENQLKIVQLNADLYPQIIQTYKLRRFPVSMLFLQKKLLFQQAGITPSKKLITIFHQNCTEKKY